MNTGGLLQAVDEYAASLYRLSQDGQFLCYFVWATYFEALRSGLASGRDFE